MARVLIGLAVVLLLLILVLPPVLNNQRMARNATSAALVVKALIEAQEIYHRTDHDGDKRLEYSFTMADLARVKLLPEELAAAELSQPNCKPYNGYVFRILTAQGPNAPGGEKLWVDKAGELTFAHGAVAFPAEYGITGKDHFIISSAGTIYQVDIGAEKSMARHVPVFDPPPNMWPHGDGDSE